MLDGFDGLPFLLQDTGDGRGLVGGDLTAAHRTHHLAQGGPDVGRCLDRWQPQCDSSCGTRHIALAQELFSEPDEHCGISGLRLLPLMTTEGCLTPCSASL